MIPELYMTKITIPSAVVMQDGWMDDVQIDKLVGLKDMFWTIYEMIYVKGMLDKHPLY